MTFFSVLLVMFRWDILPVFCSETLVPTFHNTVYHKPEYNVCFWSRLEWVSPRLRAGRRGNRK